MGRAQVKYVIHPGFVLSKHDKDIHYIGYNTLYGVDPRNCELYNTTVNYDNEPDSYVHLYPRYDGDYAIGVKL